MKPVTITKDITWVGQLDPDLRVFDIIMTTEFGTTYNSYVVKGSEKTALIDTAKDRFHENFLENLTSVTPIKDIDYIIVLHTEPDHSGSLRYLIEENPDIKVLGSPPAIKYLQDIVNMPINSQMVKDGDSLSLGNKALRFLSVPNLHWPDSMYAYIEEDKVLFSCDSFGSHYSFEGILLSKLEDKENYRKAMKAYFDDIMGPFKPFVLRALDKIEKLDIQYILTGHGPCLDEDISSAVQMYHQWSKPANEHEKFSVVIPYVSAYGYTEKMAQAIKEGIETLGGFDVKMLDMVGIDTSEAVDEIIQSDGFLLGTPTILSDALKPIWDITSQLNPIIVKDKYASAFGSYGWSGEGVPHIIERLKQLRLKVSDGISIKFNPNEEKLESCRQFGMNFAQQILSIKKTVD